MDKFDIIIIGAGPAGISAATYAARARLSVLVLGDPKKGALYKAHKIGNIYPFDSDVSGKYVTELSIKQAERFGASFHNKEAIGLKQDEYFTVTLEDLKEVNARYVIIATGKSFNIAGIPNERNLTGKGIHYCVICDGFFYKSKKIAVVGNANSAAEEALNLTAYTNDITIITNGKQKNFSKELENALEKNNIKIKNQKISKFEGSNNLEMVHYSDNSKEFYDGCFIALGSASAFNFGLELGLEMEGQNIKIDRDGKTNIRGLYAAGDCTGSNAQVAKSVGEGCNAALSIAREITGRKTILDYD